FQASVLSTFMGVSVAIAAWAVLEMVIDTIRGADKRDESFAESPFFRMALPFIQAVARGLERFKFLDKMRDSLDRSLVMAGKPERITPAEIMAPGVLACLTGLAVSFYFDYMLGGVGPEVYMAVTLLTTLLPFMSLNDMIKRRHHKIRRILPYTLDL